MESVRNQRIRFSLITLVLTSLISFSMYPALVYAGAGGGGAGGTDSGSSNSGTSNASSNSSTGSTSDADNSGAATDSGQSSSNSSNAAAEGVNGEFASGPGDPIYTPAPGGEIACAIGYYPSIVYPGGAVSIVWDAPEATDRSYVLYRNGVYYFGPWGTTPSGSATASYADILNQVGLGTITRVDSVSGPGGSGSCSGTLTVAPAAPSCEPSTNCGVTVNADCTQTGTYDFSLPGCGATTPSGCGVGTLNDTCPLGDEDGDGDGNENPTQCPLGWALVNGACVYDGCPLGWQLIDNACVFDACPQGYVRQGNACVAGCQAGYFYCGTGANASTLYQRSYTAAPACVAQDLIYAVCDNGCNAVRGACNPTPESNASINARPKLVRTGDTTLLEWNAASVLSCVVTGTNGDRWTCSGSACANNSRESSAISTQTTFMLSCDVENAPDIVKTTTVNIVPVFIEQ